MQKLTSILGIEYQLENVLIHSSPDIREIEYSITQEDIEYYLAVQTTAGETHFIVRWKPIKKVPYHRLEKN